MKATNPVFDAATGILTVSFVPDPPPAKDVILNGAAYEALKTEDNETAAADIKAIAVALGYALPKVG